MSNEIEALRKEVLTIRGYQLALGFVVGGLLTQMPAQDVEPVFATAEAFLLQAGLPVEVATGALKEIRALRSSYRKS